MGSDREPPIIDIEDLATLLPEVVFGIDSEKKSQGPGNLVGVGSQSAGWHSPFQLDDLPNLTDIVLLDTCAIDERVFFSSPCWSAICCGCDHVVCASPCMLCGHHLSGGDPSLVIRSGLLYLRFARKKKTKTEEAPVKEIVAEVKKEVKKEEKKDEKVLAKVAKAVAPPKATHESIGKLVIKKHADRIRAHPSGTMDLVKQVMEQEREHPERVRQLAEYLMAPETYNFGSPMALSDSPVCEARFLVGFNVGQAAPLSPYPTNQQIFHLRRDPVVPLIYYNLTPPGSAQYVDFYGYNEAPVTDTFSKGVALLTWGITEPTVSFREETLCRPAYGIDRTSTDYVSTGYLSSDPNFDPWIYVNCGETLTWGLRMAGGTPTTGTLTILQVGIALGTDGLPKTGYIGSKESSLVYDSGGGATATWVWGPFLSSQYVKLYFQDVTNESDATYSPATTATHTLNNAYGGGSPAQGRWVFVTNPHKIFNAVDSIAIGSASLLLTETTQVLNKGGSATSYPPLENTYWYSYNADYGNGYVGGATDYDQLLLKQRTARVAMALDQGAYSSARPLTVDFDHDPAESHRSKMCKGNGNDAIRIMHDILSAYSTTVVTGPTAAQSLMATLYCVYTFASIDQSRSPIQPVYNPAECTSAVKVAKLMPFCTENPKHLGQAVEALTNPVSMLANMLLPGIGGAAVQIGGKLLANYLQSAD